VEQQRPWAQIPGLLHSSLREQGAPTGSLPHEPFRQFAPPTHCSLAAQNVEHREPLHPPNGAQERGWVV